MLDFGGSSYICVDGLEFSGYTAKWCYAMYMGGGENHIIIKNNNIHDIKCTQPDNPDNSGANGILLFGETKEPVSNVVIADNYIHDLVTGWCEALSITSNCEYINVLGNRVENNTNIGIDFYGNNADGYCPYEELNQPRYCTAIGNEVSNCICDYAECAGIYVDGARDIVVKQNISHDNQSGIEVGSEERNENYPVKNVYVLDNYVYNNKKGIVVGGWNDTETSEDKLSGIVYDTTVKGNKVECDNGINLNIAMVDGLIVEGNEFVNTGRGGVVSSDVKTETVKNVKFKGNRYVTSVGVKFD
jgi:hypothetical protein